MRSAATLLLLAVHLLFAQAGARIEGHVIGIDGQPVPRAMVRLGNSSVVADDEGKFTFEAVPPGRYTVTAEKAGFLSATRQRTPPNTLTIAAGNEPQSVVIKLTPQAVIAGRITDAADDPVSGTVVTAMRYDYRQGWKDLASFGSARSDDKGEYRIAGLPPGQYYLRATIPLTPVQPTSEADITTFFPSTSDIAEARPLPIVAGEELRGLDIRIRRVRVYTVSGTASDPAGGAPPAGTMLTLLPKGSRLSLSGIPGAAVADVGSSGAFEFRNVQPGTYGLFSSYGVHGEVVVTSNVTGVVAAFHPFAPVIGETVMEDSSEPPVRPSLQFIPIEGATSGPSISRLQPDGTFEWSAGASKYLWSATALPGDIYIKSVTFGGQDVTHAPIDNTQGAGGTIRMVLSRQAATLTGSVRNKAGQPLPTVAVSLWQETGSVRHAASDQNGAFEFKGLAPGDYYLAAWEEIDPGLAEYPEFLSRFTTEATALKLKKADHASEDAPLIPRDRIQVELEKLP